MDRTTWTATCDKRAGCAIATVDATSYETAADALAALGWYEARRKGGRTKSHWWCPACSPKPPTRSMPSAGWR